MTVPRMSQEEFNRLDARSRAKGANIPEKSRSHQDTPGTAIPQKNKHRNVRTIYNGRTYHSIAEAKRAQALDLLMTAGEIKSWTPQPRYKLIPARGHGAFVIYSDWNELIYTPDFLVEDRHGNEWAEDVKGMVKQRDRDIQKLWRSFGPCPLRIIYKDHEEWIRPENHLISDSE